MMQDYPKQLPKDAVVGFTQFERWTCFSAVKNQISDAVEKQKQTGYPESAASGEADIYYANRKLLRLAGVQIDVEGKEAEYSGVRVREGAHILLHPNVGTTQADIRSKFPGGAGKHITISSRSALVLDGEGIFIESMKLDGALHIVAVKGASVRVRDLTVNNQGWEITQLSEGEAKRGTPERYLIRGYMFLKPETHYVLFDKPGDYSLSNAGLPSVTFSGKDIAKREELLAGSKKAAEAKLLAAKKAGVEAKMQLLAQQKEHFAARIAVTPRGALPRSHAWNEHERSDSGRSLTSGDQETKASERPDGEITLSLPSVRERKGEEGEPETDDASSGRRPSQHLRHESAGLASVLPWVALGVGALAIVGVYFLRRRPH